MCHLTDTNPHKSQYIRVTLARQQVVDLKGLLEARRLSTSTFEKRKSLIY